MWFYWNQKVIYVGKDFINGWGTSEVLNRLFLDLNDVDFRTFYCVIGMLICKDGSTI